MAGGQGTHLGFPLGARGRVAREAGVAQATFYVHFRNPGDLLRTLGEEAGRQLDSALREARRTEPA